jgi:hypothetical protein
MTTSLEAGGVGGWHDHYEVQGASLEFDRLINAGIGPSDGWPFYRPIVCGGWFEKKEGAHRPGAGAGSVGYPRRYPLGRVSGRSLPFLRAN